MEKVRDRIGELPDSVLDSILSLLPLKYAIRTSILSRRWVHIWKQTLLHAATFDFGKEFAKSQTREEFVSTVNKYLQLHNSDKISEFQLHFHPGDDHKADAEKWIQFATSKGVNNLTLIFCRELDGDEERIKLPETLFGCDSLIHFSVSHVDFSLPSDFIGFGALVTLRLNRVSITDETFESILSNCPLLTNLCLRLCSGTGSIKVSGPDLKLKCLSLIATHGYAIDVFAPNLESLHFVGDLYYGYEIRNAASLQDLFLSAYGYEFSEPEHDFRVILGSFSHVKILTICIAAPMNITIWKEYFPDALPINFPKLQELQLIIGGQIEEEYLGYMFGFFEETTFPCLEKLFIDLSGSYVPWRPDAKEAEEPSSCVFNNLKSLKINQFRGSDTEIKMVKFFLDRAVSLELLVLVAAPNSQTEKDVHNSNNNGSASRSGTSIESMEGLLDRLLILPKSAHNAQILLFDHSEVDVILTPVHNHSDYYDDGTCCN